MVITYLSGVLTAGLVFFGYKLHRNLQLFMYINILYYCMYVCMYIRSAIEFNEKLDLLSVHIAVIIIGKWFQPQSLWQNC